MDKVVVSEFTFLVKDDVSRNERIVLPPQHAAKSPSPIAKNKTAHGSYSNLKAERVQPFRFLHPAALPPKTLLGSPSPSSPPPDLGRSHGARDRQQQHREDSPRSLPTQILSVAPPARRFASVSPPPPSPPPNAAGRSHRALSEASLVAKRSPPVMVTIPLRSSLASFLVRAPGEQAAPAAIPRHSPSSKNQTTQRAHRLRRRRRAAAKPTGKRHAGIDACQRAGTAAGAGEWPAVASDARAKTRSSSAAGDRPYATNTFLESFNFSP